MGFEGVFSAEGDWGKEVRKASAGDELHPNPRGSSHHRTSITLNHLYPRVILGPGASPKDEICTLFWTRPLLFCWEQFFNTLTGLCGRKDNSAGHLCLIFFLCYWLHSARSRLLLLAFFFFSYDYFLDSIFVFVYTVDQYGLISLLSLKPWLSLSSCLTFLAALLNFSRERKKLVGWPVAIQRKWSLLIHLFI